MIISIGSDHGGYTVKKAISKWLLESGHTVRDFGIYAVCGDIAI